MSQPSNNSGSGKNLDNLFRESIGKQEFTPSPGVWKSLNLKLLVRELIHFNFINVPKLALISAAGSIVIVATLSYWAFLSGNAPTSMVNPAVPEKALVQPSPQQNISTISLTEPVDASSKPLPPTVSKEVKPTQTAYTTVKRNPTGGTLIASNTKIERSLPVEKPISNQPAQNNGEAAAAMANADISSIDP
ncbi:MAG: hypothetical protein NTW31_12345, partial [Bacteroidetes bacterium]|nr:hypothetical protein [Bacteroidota bacterium]